MSQAADLLNWLKRHKTITPRQAIKYLGIYRVADPIHKLRRDHNIETDEIDVRSRRGTSTVAKYIYHGPRGAA